jgi:hypothetical protein
LLRSAPQSWGEQSEYRAARRIDRIAGLQSDLGV